MISSDTWLAISVVIAIGLGILLGWFFYRRKFKSIGDEKKILEDPEALVAELTKEGYKIIDDGKEIIIGTKLNTETGKKELTIKEVPLSKDTKDSRTDMLKAFEAREKQVIDAVRKDKKEKADKKKAKKKARSNSPRTDRAT